MPADIKVKVAGLLGGKAIFGYVFRVDSDGVHIRLGFDGHGDEQRLVVYSRADEGTLWSRLDGPEHFGELGAAVFSAHREIERIEAAKLAAEKKAAAEKAEAERVAVKLEADRVEAARKAAADIAAAKAEAERFAAELEALRTEASRKAAEAVAAEKTAAREATSKRLTAKAVAAGAKLDRHKAHARKR